MFDLRKKEDIDAIRSRAKATARAHGFHDLADDFAGQVFIWFCAGQRAHATFDQMFIDFLRLEYGDTRTVSGAKRSLARRYQPVESIENLSDGDRNADGCSGLERLTRECSLLFRGRDLDIYERLCAFETQESMALDHGVTAARISQIVKKIKSQIERVKILREANERREFDSDFGVFRVDWIRL